MAEYSRSRLKRVFRVGNGNLFYQPEMPVVDSGDRLAEQPYYIDPVPSHLVRVNEARRLSEPSFRGSKVDSRPPMLVPVEKRSSGMAFIVCASSCFMITFMIACFVIGMALRMRWQQLEDSTRTRDCAQKWLLNNGVCNKNLIFNFDCKFDLPDCRQEHKSPDVCSQAAQLAHNDCDKAEALKHHFKHCNIHLKHCHEHHDTKERTARTTKPTTTPVETTTTTTTTTTPPITTTATGKKMTVATTITTTTTTTSLPTTPTTTTTTKATSIVYPTTTSTIIAACPGQYTSWIGDGACDDLTNYALCHFDGGDCCKQPLIKGTCLDCLCLEQTTTTHSDTTTTAATTTYTDTDDATGCPEEHTSLIDNGICDSVTNIAICYYDGGDCLMDLIGDIFTPYYPYCQYNLELYNDSICHDQLNTEVCGYDGGDCCNSFASKQQCDDCQCKGSPEYLAECPLSWSSIIGDNYCDDQLNIPTCGYDGGDCCGSNVKKTYCDKCQCLDQIYEEDPNNTNWEQPDYYNVPSHCEYYHDGYCDDGNNNEECNFDGGDCCTDEHFFFCSKCECIGQPLPTKLEVTTKWPDIFL